MKQLLRKIREIRTANLNGNYNKEVGELLIGLEHYVEDFTKANKGEKYE